MQSFREFIKEQKVYTNNPTNVNKLRVTICYLDPIKRTRVCRDVYTKNKLTILSLKTDNGIKGFPKGADFESFKQL